MSATCFSLFTSSSCSRCSEFIYQTNRIREVVSLGLEMDAAEKPKSKAGGGGGGLLDQILPPRLEDAGLEDCALPPEAIREAFFKAATAVKSRATSLLSSHDGPTAAEHPPTDVVTGNEVVVGGMEESEGKACVDGLQGLDISNEAKKKKQSGEEEGDAEKPTFA